MADHNGVKQQLPEDRKLTEAAPIGIRFIGDLSKVHVQPGDLFVLRLDEIISHDSLGFIHASFKAVVPEARLLVLGKGMTVQVFDQARALAELASAQAAAA